MRFDLTDLQLFVHILDSGTLTAAAAQSQMTLASASERVRGMEMQLGTALLERGARGVRPTEAGHTLGLHARHVLQQMERMRGDLGEYGNGLVGQIIIRANAAAAGEHLPAAIAGFAKAQPLAAVELQEFRSEDVVEGVRHGLCDMGICSDAVDTGGLHTIAWRTEPLVVVMPVDHPLARRVSVRLSELVGLDWVGMPRASSSHALLQQHAQMLGHSLRWRVQLEHLDGICHLVGQGVGVAVLPATAARRHAARHGARTIGLQEPWAQRQLLLVTHPDHQLPQHAQLLLEHLQAQAQPLSAR